MDKKKRKSYEEIQFPKAPNSLEQNQYSFMSDLDSPPGSPSNEKSRVSAKEPEDKNPLMSPPPLYSANDYGIDSICLQPKLIKALMHRKVIKISSGGVHNICVVEPFPSSIVQDVYHSFMQAKYTDVMFRGFYSTA
mmetsp:Transcript_21921/g.16266  ORF Transcript_21921/g.16266 Transcript_21921/m.16266 type:complete len:136 (+) Transcript_21921:1302-1709(+)